MSKVKRQKQTAKRDIDLVVMERMKAVMNTKNKLTTHEPSTPNNWPQGHVGIAEAEEKAEECFIVTIHGVQHYLHASTAYELYKMMGTSITKWDKFAKEHGAPGVINE